MTTDEMMDKEMDKELDVMIRFLGPMTLLEEIEWLEQSIKHSEQSIKEMHLIPHIDNGDMSLGFTIVNLEAEKRRLHRLKQLN